MDTTTQEEKELEAKLAALIQQAMKVNQKIHKDGEESDQQIDEIAAEAKKIVGKIEASCAEFEEVEKAADEAIDKLILEESQDEADNEGSDPKIR